jgi:hypothetical protein
MPSFATSFAKPLMNPIIPIFVAIYWLMPGWRLLGASKDGDKFYLDVKSAKFQSDGTAQLWIRTVERKETYTVQSYEVNCNRGIRTTSSFSYAADGKVTAGSEQGGEWQHAIPDTLGEQFYDGVCSEVE